MLRQLEVIQKKFRDSPIMHGVIKDLDTDRMKAVAEYVQSKWPRAALHQRRPRRDQLNMSGCVAASCS